MLYLIVLRLLAIASFLSACKYTTVICLNFNMNMLTSLTLIIVCLINMYSHLQQSVNSYSLLMLSVVHSSDFK